MKEPLRAADLAAMLGRLIFDREDAAELLGISPGSLETASERGRIPYVGYGAKKFYAKGDLLDYAAARGRGRDSQLRDAKPIIVKPSKGAKTR